MITTHSAQATFALGQQLGQRVQPGQVIALSGDLGAGKTLFTQGLAAGLGVTQRVTSPTFTLVNEYATARAATLIHIDTYRLGATDALTNAEAEREAASFGLAEILDRGDAIVVIEWAERVASLLPADHLHITLQHDPIHPEVRQIRMIATGGQSAQLIN